MRQDSRSSADEMRSMGFGTLAISAFLTVILASHTSILAAELFFPDYGGHKENNEVIAVDAFTGRLLWRCRPWRLSGADCEMYRAGLVVNGELFLDPNTGKAIKPFELESTACLARSTTFRRSSKIRLDNGWELSGAKSSAGRLQFVESVSGKPVWAVAMGRDRYVFAIDCWKNSAFFAIGYFSDEGVVYAYDAGAIKPTWTVDVNQIVKGQPERLTQMYISVIDDALYIQVEQHVFVLDPKTGELLWHRDVAKDLDLRFVPDFYGGGQDRALLVKSQNLLVMAFERRVVALDVKTMKYLWHMQPDAFPGRVFPMIYEGKVFLNSGDKRRIYQMVPDAQPRPGHPEQTFRELDWHGVPLVIHMLPWQQLVDAIEREDFGNAHRLIDAGAEVNAEDRRGTTAIYSLAARRPDREEGIAEQLSLFQHLLKAGAKIDPGIETGTTPLMTAILSGSEQLALGLINAGAKVTYGKGITSPLHSYFALRSPALVQALVAAGANVNVQDAHGRTPLHSAAFVGESDGQTYELIRMLVEAGGDLSIKDNKGRNPIEFARYYQEPKIAEFMESLKKEARPKLPNRAAQPAPSRGSGAAADSPKPGGKRGNE